MKQHETNNAYAKIPNGTVARESHALGLNENEPLIYGMDGMIRYAKAHAMAYGSRLAIGIIAYQLCCLSKGISYE